MARHLGRCSRFRRLFSDWTGRRSGVELGSADGHTPGALQGRLWGFRVQRAFAGRHGRQVADSLFLPLRDRQLRAHGAGAVRGRGQLREAGEL